MNRAERHALKRRVVSVVLCSAIILYFVSFAHAANNTIIPPTPQVPQTPQTPPPQTSISAEDIMRAITDVKNDLKNVRGDIGTTQIVVANSNKAMLNQQHDDTMNIIMFIIFFSITLRAAEHFILRFLSNKRFWKMRQQQIVAEKAVISTLEKKNELLKTENEKLKEQIGKMLQMSKVVKGLNEQLDLLKERMIPVAVEPVTTSIVDVPKNPVNKARLLRWLTLLLLIVFLGLLLWSVFYG